MFFKNPHQASTPISYKFNMGTSMEIEDTPKHSLQVEMNQTKLWVLEQ